MSKYSKDIPSNIDSAYKKRSLFGRRQGRAIRGERAYSLEHILPQIEIPECNLKEDHTLSPQSLYQNNFDQYHLEIGFGHGERLIEDFKRQPKTGFIGAEPFINGMADFVKNIEEPVPDNLRVIMDDGMILARSIVPSSLDKVYILNPDPWHKKRHHKRRIINQINLDIFARILKPQGELILTTDVENTAEWMCTQTCNHPSFEWQAHSQQDWLKKPDNWIPTRYEEKGAKGAKKMIYLFYTNTK